MKDQTFTIQKDCHQVVVDGRVVRATWNSSGAAKAGIAVEKRRNEQRKLKVNVNQNGGK
jgi:hypothetical protein